MSLSNSDKNTFRRWVGKLKAETDLLAEHATDDPIKEVAHEFVRLTSKWSNLFDHAKRIGIEIDGVDVSSIEGNLTRIKKVIERRQGNPHLDQIIRPVLDIADNLDKILHVFTGRKIFRPIAEAFLALTGWVSNLLAPPKDYPLLPAPSDFPDYFSEAYIDIEETVTEDTTYLLDVPDLDLSMFLFSDSQDEFLNMDRSDGVDLNDNLENISRDENDKLFPNSGYAWLNNELGDFRVIWVPGKAHLYHPNVIASSKEGGWFPASGYKWVASDEGDFRVVFNEYGE